MWILLNVVVYLYSGLLIVGRTSAFHVNCHNSLKTKTFQSMKHSMQLNITTELTLIFKGL